jgi:hypothetical protein
MMNKNNGETRTTSGLKRGGLAPFMHWHQDKPGCCVKANVFEIVSQWQAAERASAAAAGGRRRGGNRRRRRRRRRRRGASGGAAVGAAVPRHQYYCNFELKCWLHCWQSTRRTSRCGLPGCSHTSAALRLS